MAKGNLIRTRGNNLFLSGKKLSQGKRLEIALEGPNDGPLWAPVVFQAPRDEWFADFILLLHGGQGTAVHLPLDARYRE